MLNKELTSFSRLYSKNTELVYINKTDRYD